METGIAEKRANIETNLEREAYCIVESAYPSSSPAYVEAVSKEIISCTLHRQCGGHPQEHLLDARLLGSLSVDAMLSIPVDRSENATP
jgi:hypothetical protein